MTRVLAKTKAAVVASSLALIGALIALGGIWYMIEHSASRLEEVEKEIARLVEEERSFKALENLERETTADRAELESYILEQSEFVDFLSLLETTGAQAGVEVTTKSIQASGAAAEGFETVVVMSELTGSFQAVRTVLDLYEQLPYQLRLTQVSLDRMGEEGDEWRSAITLEVTKVTP